MATRLELAKARTLISQGESRDALAVLGDLDAQGAAAAPRELFVAIAECRDGNFTDAQAAAEKAIELAPDNLLARNWLAVIQARRGKTAEALATLRETGLIPYGEIIIELGLIFEKILLENPEARAPSEIDPETLRAMAAGDLSSAPKPKNLTPRQFENAYFRQDWQALLRYGVHCLRRTDSEVEGRMVIIHLMLESNMTDDGLKCARVNAEQNAENPMAQSQLGLAAIRSGDVREALVALSHVEIEGPEDFNCHWHMGLAALRAGNEPEARQFFTKAINDYFIGTFEDSWCRLWHTISSDHFLNWVNAR